jgi:hypothetical protein
MTLGNINTLNASLAKFRFYNNLLSGRILFIAFDLYGRSFKRQQHAVCLKAPRAVREINMVMRPAGFGTKNHCAGEDQQ